VKLCGFEAGLDRPLFLIAGPDTLESEQLCLDVAGELKEATGKLGMPYIFKGSFDKANRTSGKSYRGPGVDEGLRILAKVKKQIGVPVLTDVHEDTPLAEVAEVVDVIQTPAFLCRQTNFIRNAASQGKPLNIKKGQFLSPWEMRHAIEKVRAAGNDKILVTERGASFGYQNLVVDYRSLVILRGFGCPVVMDATHAVQLPGGQGDRSGGEAEFIPALARAAAAVGVDALFCEVHDDPGRAKSDGPNALALPLVEPLLRSVMAIDQIARGA